VIGDPSPSKSVMKKIQNKMMALVVELDRLLEREEKARKRSH
jgi:hypothetical protein